MTVTSAVVGAGTVSGIHLSGLDACPHTDLVAVCDLDEERARDVARAHDITPYYDLESMLDAESLDWVHVCTSVQSHLPLARQCFDAGVPVLIEKPVTQNTSEFEELVAASEALDVPFSVVHNHLYDPVMRRARARIESGDLGSIRGVDLVYTGLTAPDARHRGSWVFDLPGGEFTEGLPHPLYVGIEAAGYPASMDALSVRTSRFGEYEQGFAYDSALVQYRTETEGLCSIMMLSGGVSQRLLQIHGERRTLEVDLISQTMSPLSRDYTGSRLGQALNTTDRVFARTWGTLENVVALARNGLLNDWESTRNITPHYYQFDVEARALLRGDHPDPNAEPRARWTVTLLEAINTTDDGGATPDELRSGGVVDGHATGDR